jgi:hypothetical protein
MFEAQQERLRQLETLATLVRKAMRARKGEPWESAKSLEWDPFAAIERQMAALEATRPKRRWHYAIISPFYGDQIGCTWGEEGKAAVLEEEPGATFQRLAAKACPICEGKYPSGWKE